MSHTYYNSLDTACKTPFGAVPAGQEVTFRLTVPESLGYVFGESGPAAELLHKYGLDAEGIYSQIKDFA